ncbi:MAG TPA: SGNH hydrolase domain-containing protein, partial [Solirubrobacteraceae bacterium]|nr:SGNH hydrolase domain-containing protein [Solirubrobacteraceae bacterium]
MRRAIPMLALAAALLPAADAGTAPRCFGAAARDHIQRCHNPRLLRMVRPTPAQALRLPNAPCRIPRRQYPLVCEFGAPENTAYKRIALIGDSHATHWRSALGPVAEQRGWAGFSLTRAGCALSAATPRLRDGLTGECLRWRAAVHAWLTAHPGVDTLFVSQHRARVKGGYEAEVAGYLEAWRTLPASIERVVVVRDTPKRPSVVRRCVVAAIARGANAGRACAMARAAVL